MRKPISAAAAVFSAATGRAVPGPAVFGVMMMIGGLGWLTFLSPALAGQLKPWNMLLGVIAETALTVWLLAKGVSPERWRAQAGARSP